ncbi:MAG TPA: alpha-E domain-containing protein [Patescibacteria group bacterium]|nr:alpha-E domain-containing protein [Patescibacteria group bacterium]
MLSRAATSLTLLGRHLERADHLARVLGVHVSLALDRNDEPGPEFWMRFMDLSGRPRGDVRRREQAIAGVIGGTPGPSVQSSVAQARLAAHSVRPTLPSELFEHVNALNRRVQGEGWKVALYPFLNDVQMSNRLVDGMLEDTMFHDEVRDFVFLGKFVERTANVTALVIRKWIELADSPEDALEWTAVLRSCFAFESYQSRYSGGVTPDRVVECLLLDPVLPRSARFAAGASLDAVTRIDGAGGRKSGPRRLLGKLKAMYDQADAQTFTEHASEFDADVKALLRQLEIAMRETYFHPSHVPTSVMGDEGHNMPQQQQQRQEKAP